MNQPINTVDLQFVGRGAESCVYVHPHHPARCIKACHPNSKTRWLPILQWKARNEAKYVQRMHGKFADLPVPKYYGEIRVMHDGKLTSAHCYELIRDANGEVSKYMGHPDTTARVEREALLAAADAMFDRMVAINFSCLFLESNTLCQFTADGFRLVVVDDIGLKPLWHPCHWIPAYGRHRIRRKYHHHFRRHYK